MWKLRSTIAKRLGQWHVRTEKGGHHWLIGGHGGDSHLAVNSGFNKSRGIGTLCVSYSDQQYFTPMLVISRQTNDAFHLHQRLWLAACLRLFLSFTFLLNSVRQFLWKALVVCNSSHLAITIWVYFRACSASWGFLLMFDCGMSGSRNICTYNYKSLLEWLDCFSSRDSDSSRWSLLTTGV